MQILMGFVQSANIHDNVAEVARHIRKTLKTYYRLGCQTYHMDSIGKRFAESVILATKEGSVIDAYRRYYAFDLAPKFWGEIVNHVGAEKIVKIKTRVLQK